MSATIDRKCSVCGSTNLQYGKIGPYRHTFIPESKMMWVGYDLLAFLCLDCGAVSEYLQDKDVRKIQEEQAKKKS